MMNFIKTIQWVALPHCPQGQLIKPGDPTDAGYDIKAAKDMIIRPFVELPFEWESIGNIKDKDPEFVDELRAMDERRPKFYDIKIDEDGNILRQKFKPQLVPTGIKLQPKDLMWCGIYNRSGNPGKYNYALANSVGVIDFEQQ
jgi:dUTPase